MSDIPCIINYDFYNSIDKLIEKQERRLKKLVEFSQIRISIVFYYIYLVKRS